MTSYGQFSEDGLEYRIDTPHPPRDWFNFLWNPTYLACVGQNLNGFSLYQNDAGVATNLFGKQDERESLRSLYVRDQDSGETWSAGYYPCCTEHDVFECCHGLGFTRLTTEFDGIRVSLRIFVPRNHPCEVWTIDVTNLSARPRRLSLFSMVDIRLDGVHLPYGYVSGLSAECLADDGMLFFRNTTHTVVDEKYRAFMFATKPFDHWDVSRAAFLGRTRNAACPERVKEGRLSDSVASVENLAGAVQHDLTLSPNGTEGFSLVLGVTRDLNEARETCGAFSDSVLVEEEFEATVARLRQRLGGLRLETPDADFNRLFTVWMKHQLHLMADWARFYFKGYRDACQDAAGMSIIDPARATEMLRQALANQRSDGFCPRAFRVASMDIAAADKHYADSPSWIAHALDAILRETGDLALLDERVPYSDQGEGTVWEHCVQAMEFLWNDRGLHGLSLMHCGDWNDLLDKVGAEGRGESVWMSFALARVLRLTADMADWKGDGELAARCRQRFAELKEDIHAHGWDGDYFLYAINDDGMKVGTHEAVEGAVFINPQSWAMLSGVVGAEEYTEVARGIEPAVDTPVGPVQCWPPFTEYQAGIGQLSGTPPGYFTNGNVYCHAAAFKIAADYEAGRAEKAFDTLMRILPRAERSEPYAQANGYIGPTALRGQRHVSDDPWRTGTVAWNFLNVVDRLLGFRRTLAGFHLRPQLPECWDQVRFFRPFRGRIFEVEVRRSAEPGLRVDGVSVAGDFVAVPPDAGTSSAVRVVCEIKLREPALDPADKLGV